MRPPKHHKISTAADHVGPIYRSDEPVELIAKEGETLEGQVFRVAADQVIETQTRGVLQPALRVMLDAMTQDYAKILTRIDQLATESKDDSFPAIPDKRDEN